MPSRRSGAATAGALDLTSKITTRPIWLILAVVSTAFVLLTMALRSIVIATRAASAARSAERAAQKRRG